MSVYKRGSKWVADFYVGGRNGRRVRKSAPTRELAEAKERDAKVREFRGEIAQETKPNIPFSEFITNYEKIHEPNNATTTQRRDGLVTAHFLKFIGKALIRQITNEDIEAYKAFRKRSVSAGTVNLELRVLKSVFNRAKDWNYVRENPVEKVKQYRLDTKPVRFLSPEEGARLIETTKGQLRTFVALGLHTGMRYGEMCSLRWADVDFQNSRITVQKAKGKRFRVIPMNSFLYGILRHHPRHITSDFVLHNQDGSPWGNRRKSFATALKRAGLPRIRIHDLRHSFVSNLVMAGEDLRTVQELAGHRSVTTTMRYAHLAPGKLRASVEKLVCNVQENRAVVGDVQG